MLFAGKGGAERDRRVAPAAAVYLPVAYVLHLAEEWIGGFPAWTLRAIGREVSHGRFVLINSVAFVCLAVGTVAALRSPRAAWLAVSIAALLVLNALLHALGTVVFGAYSPGVVTGVLLYLPLGLVVLRDSSARLTGQVFIGAALFGVVLHGIVSLLAFAV